MLGRFGRCLVAVPVALGAATLVALVLFGIGSLLLILAVVLPLVLIGLIAAAARTGKAKPRYDSNGAGFSDRCSACLGLARQPPPGWQSFAHDRQAGGPPPGPGPSARHRLAARLPAWS